MTVGRTSNEAPAPATVVRHIIGQARQFQTAVLACEYLRRRHIHLNGEFSWKPEEPTGENGWWVAALYFIPYTTLNLDTESLLVAECRAFVAGRGEIWA